MNTIEELRQLLAEAGGDRWKIAHVNGYPTEIRYADEPYDVVANTNMGLDASLIVAMRNALPALLDLADAVQDLDRFIHEYDWHYCSGCGATNGGREDCKPDCPWLRIDKALEALGEREPGGTAPTDGTGGAGSRSPSDKEER